MHIKTNPILLWSKVHTCTAVCFYGEHSHNVDNNCHMIWVSVPYIVGVLCVLCKQFLRHRPLQREAPHRPWRRERASFSQHLGNRSFNHYMNMWKIICIHFLSLWGRVLGTRIYGHAWQTNSSLKYWGPRKYWRQMLNGFYKQDNWWEGRQCLSLRPVYNVKACGGKVGLSRILFLFERQDKFILIWIIKDRNVPSRCRTWIEMSKSA